MVKILNILAIVFPLLIIVFGLIRYYSDGKRSFSGIINFIALLLLVMGLFRYFFIGSGGGSGSSTSSGGTAETVTVSKHSDAFNKSMESVLDAYYKMTESFVNWDTLMINSTAAELKIALDSLKIAELQKDPLIYQTVQDFYNNSKAEVAAIIADPSISEKRGSLNILSDQIKNLWSVVKYDRQKAYWQECPMAFGDDKPANWLSKTEEVRNPYLGTKHPEYGNGMLNCGGPKDTLKFDPPATPVDTTKTK